MHIEEIRYYDVVFDIAMNYKNKPHDFTHHVGNARFVVFIDIYSERFIKALRSGDIEGCYDVVHEVVQTICNNQGRFLAYTDQYQFRDLGYGKKVQDIIFRKICEIKRKQLSPIEQARLGKAVKMAKQRQKPIDLKDDRFKLNTQERVRKKRKSSASKCSQTKNEIPMLEIPQETQPMSSFNINSWQNLPPITTTELNSKASLNYFPAISFTWSNSKAQFHFCPDKLYYETDFMRKPSVMQ